MFRIIISNIWRRRRQNIWLFLELIIVTILTWVIADPTVVGIYDIHADQGYDTDRLVYIAMENIPSQSSMYDHDAAYSPDLLARDRDIMITQLKNMPEVENATCVSCPLGGDSYGYISMSSEWMSADSIYLSSPYIRVYNNSDFFKTYGIEAVDGFPSTDELMSGHHGNNDFIITESLYRKFWGDQRGLSDKYFVEYEDHGDYVDSVRYNIVGVVKDFHVNSFIRSTMNVMQIQDFIVGDLHLPPKIVVRLKEGINADSFAKERLEELCDMLRTGSMYVKSVSSQNAFISKAEAIRGLTASRTLNIFVAGLFLINLIVGVVGCVWLQTVKRIKEVGVLRSYGAVRSNITGMLIGESVVMATVAVIIGCVAYLQYAVKQGLSVGVINNRATMQQASWVTDFGSHFAIISAIVYALIIICVVVGTYFPARHVSRIEPVDALRDE